MQDTTNHCIVYDNGEVHDYQPLHKKTVWLRQFLTDVEYVHEGPTSIICNNKRCVTLAKKATNPFHTKHIDVQHHFIRSKRNQQNQRYCPTEYMIANVITKTLTNDRHQTLIKAMGSIAFNYLQIGSIEGRTIDYSLSIEIQ